MADDQRRLEELLSGLVDDELTSDERREALALVEGNLEARALYERMRAMAGAMRAETPPDPPPELATKISTSLRKARGELLVPARRRWLGPAALTAAASVAAALLIGALLHDHWEVFAPKLNYQPAPEFAGEARPEPQAEAETGVEAEKKEQTAPEPDDAQVVQEAQELLEAMEMDSAVAQDMPATPPPPVAKRAVPSRDDARDAAREKKAGEARVTAALEKSVTEGAGMAAVSDELVEEESRQRQESLAARAAPKSGRPTCTSPWISSTRVGRAEGAPEDADAQLLRLVVGLGGRMESAPDRALIIPATGVVRFIESLPATGHVFIGPTPVLPKGRDCLKLSLQM